MQTNTLINGLSHVSSNSTGPDGDTLQLVNLRLKNQSLQTVTEGKKVASLSNDYDIVFIHSNNNLESWLGVKNSVLFYKIKAEPEMVCELNTRILQIQSIGNTLALFTEDGIFYLLYKNNTYKPLGYKPEFPYVKIQCIGKISVLHFSDIDGTIKDPQQAMEALLVKNRWREENANLLCGAYCVRYALKLFDNTYIQHSSPIFIILDSNNHPYVVSLAVRDETLLKEDSFIRTSLFYLNLDIDTAPLTEWSEIVTGIDIFISPELGLISEDFKKIEDSTINSRPPIASSNFTRKTIHPLDIDAQTISNQIEQIDNFYLIRSIPINTKDKTFKFPEKSFLSDLRNIVHQPTLGIDNFSHHFITATTTYTYNQRLHIANIQTYFYKGFDFRAFTPEKSQYYPRPDPQETSRPPRPGQTSEEYTAKKVYIQIFINDQDDIYVISKIENITYLKINPILAYPDSRAYKAIITITDIYDNIKQQAAFSLKPHANLNIAYYFDQSLDKIQLTDKDPTPFTSQEIQHKLREENKVKVSALQNPFLFPNENTYIAGNGKVIGMAANSTPVSEGQFGQYPLYLFTAEGIYILAVGSGDIVYSNIAPVSEEIAIQGTILPVSGAVFFITKRGAYIISGSQPKMISAQINVETILQNIEHIHDIVNIIFPDLSIPNKPFLKFIREEQLSVHFNYTENEVIINSFSAGFAYVYNFNSQSWYTSTFVFAPVENCFPNLFGIKNRDIIDVSKEIEKPAPVFLITRPIKFNSQQFKNLHRLILRSYIDNPAPIGFFTLSGNDGINFHIKTNKRITPGKHRDIDSGLISLNKYRYYAFILLGYLNKDSRIDFFSSTIYPVYSNDKNR